MKENKTIEIKINDLYKLLDTLYSMTIYNGDKPNKENVNLVARYHAGRVSAIYEIIPMIHELMVNSNPWTSIEQMKIKEEE